MMSLFLSQSFKTAKWIQAHTGDEKTADERLVITPGQTL